MRVGTRIKKAIETNGGNRVSMRVGTWIKKLLKLTEAT